VKISVYWLPDDKGHFQVLRRCAPELERMGHVLRWVPYMEPVSSDDADAIVVHNKLLSKGTADSCGSRLIVFERSDCSLPLSRWYAEHDNVVAIVKGQVATLDAMNASKRRLHSDMMDGVVTHPETVLSETEYVKYVPWGHFGAFDHIDYLASGDGRIWNKPRTIDVFFAGRTSTYPEPVRSHRASCAEAIQALTGLNVKAHKGRPLSHLAYIDTMLRSKVVVSPWGTGEHCYRDWEATLAGCSVVKPACAWVRTEPPLHTYECSHTWSDLEAVVHRAITEFDEMAGERQRRAAVACAAWDARSLARRFDSVLARVEGALC